MKLLAVVAERAREHRVAQRDGVAHDGVKHRLNVGRRAANDLENLGGRRLPLERLLRLVEQAHVLDRDHRLAGEGLEELHLLVAEQSGVGTGNGDGADGLTFAHHRHAERGAKPGQLRHRLNAYSGSASTSGRCTIEPLRIVLATTDWVDRRIGNSRRNASTLADRCRRGCRRESTRRRR